MAGRRGLPHRSVPPQGAPGWRESYRPVEMLTHLDRSVSASFRAPPPANPARHTNRRNCRKSRQFRRLVSGRFQSEIHVDGVVGEVRAALFGLVQHAGAQQGLDVGVHRLHVAMDAAAGASDLAVRFERFVEAADAEDDRVHGRKSSIAARKSRSRASRSVKWQGSCWSPIWRWLPLPASLS